MLRIQLQSDGAGATGTTCAKGRGMVMVSGTGACGEERMYTPGTFGRVTVAVYDFPNLVNTTGCLLKRAVGVSVLPGVKVMVSVAPGCAVRDWARAAVLLEVRYVVTDAAVVFQPSGVLIGMREVVTVNIPGMSFSIFIGLVRSFKRS